MSSMGAYALPIQMAGQSLATSGAMRAQIEDAAATSTAFEYNALVERQRQQEIREQGHFDERQQRRLARMMVGQSVANAGGSGLALTGQRMDIIKHDAVLAEIDALRIKQNADKAIAASAQQEKFDRFQADQAKKQGKKSARSTLLTGALGMLGTGLQYYGQQQRYA